MKVASMLLVSLLCAAPVLAHEGGYDARGVVARRSPRISSLPTASSSMRRRRPGAWRRSRCNSERDVQAPGEHVGRSAVLVEPRIEDGLVVHANRHLRQQGEPVID